MRDKAGNKGTITQDVNFDTTPPVITITANSAWTNQSSVTVQAVATDPGTNPTGVDPSTWYYRFGAAGQWIKIDGITLPGQPVGLSVSPEGETTVYFKVSDVAGNVSLETSATVRIDRTAPTVSGAAFTGNDGIAIGQDSDGSFWTNKQQVNVGALTNDAKGTLATSGVQSVSWSFDGVSWSPVMPAAISAEGVTRLYLRAADGAGNVSDIYTTKVKIDRTKPIVSGGSLADSYVYGTLSIAATPLVTDGLSGPANDSFVYSFDLSTWLPIVSGSAIDVSGQGEGAHLIYLGAYDGAGNLGYDNAGYTIDRTPPSVTGVSVSANGKTYEEAGYIPSDSVLVTIVATDSSGAGVIDGYKYTVSGIPVQSPDFSSYIRAGTDFILSGLGSGTNYLYLRAVDNAGNESGTTLRLIRIDSDVPLPPLVSSSSHPKAQNVYDAVPFSDAVFTFAPKTTGSSGVAFYVYELRKGNDPGSAELVAGLSGRVSSAGVEFKGLADNLEGEFYYLFVSVESGNGRQSGYSVYPFRIDSKPPQNLTVYSTTHVDPLAYYSSSNAVFVWNRPLDFTGIKSYWYRVLASDTEPPLPDPSAFVPDASWKPTAATSLVVDLNDALSGANAGIVYLAVCAEDYAGNRQFSQRRVSFDAIKPWIVSDNEINVATSPASNEAHIGWGTPSDNIPGNVAGADVKLAKLSGSASVDLTAWITLDPAGIQERTFDGLDTDPSITYIAYIRVKDSAGNERTYSKGFSFSGAPVTLDISIPFTESILGYTIRGSVGTTSSTAGIDIPDLF